jgi:hypothetical protein
MIQWEYEVFDLFEGDVDKDAMKEEQHLNDLGAEGWKLMSVARIGGCRKRFYMKRRVVARKKP